MEITTVSVKISRRVDLGYAPYIEYLRQLAGKPPPFGTRDNSNVEFDVYLSATLAPEDEVQNAAAILAEQGKEIMRSNFMNTTRPELAAPVPEDAYVIESTTVTFKKADF